MQQTEEKKITMRKFPRSPRKRPSFSNNKQHAMIKRNRIVSSICMFMQNILKFIQTKYLTTIIDRISAPRDVISHLWLRL